MALLIYIISFLEWFTTLSIEIIAIRNFTPIVWTNSISTSIILWVILLALSYGYYIWGKNSKNKDSDIIKNKIIFNLSLASAYYFFFTFIVDIYILEGFISKTWSYFWAILLSSFFLFFIPVFLASQTIPLLSELLKWENTWEKIWKLLFFSTIWSFLGSVITSTVLFSYIWVEKSASLNSIILSSIALILAMINFKKINFSIILAMIVLAFSSTFVLAKEQLKSSILFKEANSYHNIIVFNDENNRRILLQNMWYASGIDLTTNESFFKYIIEIKNNLIKEKYESIAIIWAAWFTLPNELSDEEFVKKIDVIDVDSSLKEIAEDYFLKKDLSKKINFIVTPSRYFITDSLKQNKKYDAIVIDVYVWNSLSAQNLTYEFFEWLKNISPNIYVNMITDRKLDSDFSLKLQNTMEKAFSEVYYKDVNQYSFDTLKTNFVMTNKKIEWYTKYNKNNDLWIYFDDKNSIELDLFKIK